MVSPAAPTSSSSDILVVQVCFPALESESSERNRSTTEDKMARRGLMVGVIAWLVVASDADMYDVVEAHKVPPSTCKSSVTDRCCMIAYNEQ